MKKFSLESLIPDTKEVSSEQIDSFHISNWSMLRKVLGIETFYDFFELSKNELSFLKMRSCLSEDYCEYDEEVFTKMENYFEKFFPQTSVDYSEKFLSISIIPDIKEMDMSVRLSGVMRRLCYRENLPHNLLSLIRIVRKAGSVESIRLLRFGNKTKNELEDYLKYKLGIDKFGKPKITRVEDYLKRLEDIAKTSQPGENGDEVFNHLSLFFENHGIDVFKKLLKKKGYEVKLVTEGVW